MHPPSLLTCPGVLPSIKHPTLRLNISSLPDFRHHFQSPSPTNDTSSRPFLLRSPLVSYNLCFPCLLPIHLLTCSKASALPYSDSDSSVSLSSPSLSSHSLVQSSGTFSPHAQPTTLLISPPVHSPPLDPQDLLESTTFTPIPLSSCPDFVPLYSF